jgi:hypothetical protein
MQPNIMPLSADLKPLAMQLLYGREISTHVAFETRDQLFSEMYKAGAASHTVKKWVTANFESDAAMQVRVHTCCNVRYSHTHIQMNTQAFRNFMFSSGYAADSAMELYFRNSKGIREEQAALAKGTIHDSLSRLFVFQTIRVSKVAIDLETLLKHHKFMDCDVPKEDTYRKSTLYRWNDQASNVYTQCNSIPQTCCR